MNVQLLRINPQVQLFSKRRRKVAIIAGLVLFLKINKNCKIFNTQFLSWLEILVNSDTKVDLYIYMCMYLNINFQTSS